MSKKRATTKVDGFPLLRNHHFSLKPMAQIHEGEKG